ncbi:MAG: YibE/F family protein [bacterium]
MKTSLKISFILLVMLIGYLFYQAHAMEEDVPFEPPPQPKFEKAVIIDAEQIEKLEYQSSTMPIEQRQSVTLKVLSGKLRGRILSYAHMASGGMLGSEMILKKGDKIIVYVEENPSKAESPDGSPLIQIDTYKRDGTLFFLAILYAVILVAVGGKKGLKALASLFLTIAIIFFIMFPLILRGMSPIFVSVVVSGIVSWIVFRIVGGKTKKSQAAALGTLIGVTIAGLLAMIVGMIMHLTGLSSEESKILLYSVNIKLNFQGLLFSGMLIGALGAVMDVGMSIASAIDEVRKIHPEATFKNLFNAGMNVGRDIMGTMSNTLILAYTGSSLPLLLLFMAGNTPFVKIMNLELVAEEIVRAFAGSIGLVLAIPITAFISAVLYSEHQLEIPEGWITGKKDN